ncbi:MAG: hypothetical protein IPI95_05735 [Flavobacteriales bacterium]|nr:hypothetical protein [Flavobacteriales bacterium]
MAPGTVVELRSSVVPHVTAWPTMGRDAGLITMALAQVVAHAGEALHSSRTNKTAAD